MVLPGLQVWRWILFACIHWLCVCQETPRPGILSLGTDFSVAGCVLCRVYMVAIPAVIQAGSEAKLCASLLQPNETLVMTISLMADGQNKRLLHESSDQEFHRCFQFQVSPPLVDIPNHSIKSVLYCSALMHRLGSLCNASLFYGKCQCGGLPELFSALQFSFCVVHGVGTGNCETYHPIIVCFHLTGITRSEEKNIELSYVIGELTFVDTPQIYAHGSIIEGKINAVRFNNTAISDMIVYLFEEKGWSSYLRLQNLTTDGRGIARFSVNTTSMPKENINLVVSDTPQVEYPGYRVPYFNRGQHVLSLIQPAAPDSKPSSSLAIQKVEKPLACGQAVSITIRYAIVGETVPKGSVDVLYLALSRGVIVQHGHVNVTVHQDRPAEGVVTLKLAVVPEMAPVVQLLVYSMLPSETVIAHSMNFPTEKCFRNKVLVEFSPSNVVPGEENTLHLSAQPGSLCGLSAVDQSVGIMEPGTRLDADKVTLLTEVNNSESVTILLQCVQLCFILLKKHVQCQIKLTVPSCLSYQGNQYYRSYVAYSHMARPGSAGPRLEMAVAGGLAAPPPPPIQTVRTFFPETWFWDLVEVGESGSADVPLTVPDTITTWETEVFCLAPSGFGLAPLVKLTVSQPFFLELTLPYSVIRGEHFELKATVFNYLSKCIMVSVTPALSSNYTLTPLRDVQDSCLCANGRKTFSWTMAPSVLGVLNVSVSAAAVQSHTACDNGVVNVPERGRIDTVTRSLLVKAEGTEKTHTYNWLLCPTGQGQSCFSIGDILGRALNNLDGLLQMPYGCGEQNMALLSPNIYILEYLRNTKQLIPAILDKATKFLTSGYQRQLNYKNADGAYSTFGQGLGNTWLTAFVLRSFGKAQSFIYVDPATMEQSKTWLERQQGKHGCFRILGKLLNNRMKGGVTDEVTLTAYITASMLELNMSDPVVDHSLSCLKNSTSDLSNTYATALLAYTFTLAGDMETRARLLQHLNAISFQEGGLLHWSQSSETSPSLEVEISSYVLLASLSASSRSTSDLGYASRIVRWLVRQQNAYGGFSSTQDTVVALQALALYSTRVFSRGGASTVAVRSPSGEQCLFHVNQSNKLLYQERALQDTEGKYSVEVKGSACASVQVSEYTSLLPVLGSHGTQYNGLHLKYTLSPPVHQNISVSKAVMFFCLDPLMTNMFFSQQLTSLFPFHITLDIIQEVPVQNLKPAVVQIYDYYQPSKLLY
uniref:Uncharacterized protein n=1 Tax=Hucho hucho TaxID=62062 RepID=A0A4W5JX13_9TELE